MKIQPFNVVPNLPRRLGPLRELAMNLWYSWNWEARKLFIRLDSDLWAACDQNPIRMLGRISQTRLEEASRDESFLASLDRIYEQFKHHLTRKGWYDRAHHEHLHDTVAYFSCEYGLDPALPIYSGGLGILSGDHLKTASDLALPLVAVGLLYSRHFCRQYLNADGWQQEQYPEIDWYTSPVLPELDENGVQRRVTVQLGDADVHVRIWRIQVGRIPLFLLDTNVEANAPEFRGITAQLYGGDRENRIRQEIVLGIGGVRALRAIGIKPAVYHINEGHSAFLALERIRQLMEDSKVSFEEAREAVWSSNVFTTHTPVPAGNERFDPGLVRGYLSSTARALGLSPEKFIDLGRSGDAFCMTTLSLRHAAHCNGVSRLHGTVSRKMWSHLWPDLPESEVPIRHVTNGVHGMSWVSHDLDELFQTYLGPRYTEEPWSPTVWARVDSIPDGELWRIHQIRRERLVFFARRQIRHRLQHLGGSPTSMAQADEILNPAALTIGFARRFATYKRATLLFSDPERLAKIVSDPNRPVQFIFSGKAHPQDGPGKEFIKAIAHFARDPRFRPHLVFVEDYDIEAARYLVSGVDVWLNNPRRPLEASGTSGMKASMNGVLNLSVLDGWWDEGYIPEGGWAIGRGETYAETQYQDFVESRGLYDLLEREVIPTFYSRDRQELPRAWITRMKSSIKAHAPRFSSHRMVMDYAEQFYVPGAKKYRTLEREEHKLSRGLAEWRKRVRSGWEQVRISDVKAHLNGELKVGSEFRIHATVELGSLKPDDVSVEVFAGGLDTSGEIREGVPSRMVVAESLPNGSHLYVAMLPCRSSGRHGFAVRVLPRNADIVHPYDSGIIAWA